MSGEAGYNPELRRVLEDLQSGVKTLEETLQRLRLFQVSEVGGFARLDINRDVRRGVPEIIYASRKGDADLEAIVRRFLDERGYALVTRLEPARAEGLARALEGVTVLYQASARVLTAYASTYQPPVERGCVGLLTAGTSDISVAEEAALVITHMGCRLERGYDIGVAGLHRLVEPLTRVLGAHAAVLVVVAGMEGALPSVVAGLVDIPVIGVPTSTGYGLGGNGTAALYAMLQSCTPGLVTVNIDNGVGAGAAAALIARGAASEA